MKIVMVRPWASAAVTLAAMHVYDVPADVGRAAVDAFAAEEAAPLERELKERARERERAARAAAQH